MAKIPTYTHTHTHTRTHLGTKTLNAEGLTAESVTSYVRLMTWNTNIVQGPILVREVLKGVTTGTIIAQSASLLRI